ncbi:hypothetical protein YK56LOC_17080 [Caballeronia sp. HLA56]
MPPPAPPEDPEDPEAPEAPDAPEGLEAPAGLDAPDGVDTADGLEAAEGFDAGALLPAAGVELEPPPPLHPPMMADTITALHSHGNAPARLERSPFIHPPFWKNGVISRFCPALEQFGFHFHHMRPMPFSLHANHTFGNIESNLLHCVTTC